jgi:hypothetical protein
MVMDAANNRWGPQRTADGYWLSGSNGYASWNGKVGRVNINTGSPTVIGVGTTNSDVHPGSGWNAVRAGNCFYIPGDAEAYTVRAVLSATELTLDRPYNGTTRQASGWQMNNLCGSGVQPFMLGIAMTAWDYGYKLTGNPAMQDFVVRAAGWLTDNGIQQSTKGLYYGRVFPNCEPIQDNNPNCAYNPNSAGSVEASRFLSGEIFGALAAAYDRTGDRRMRADVDRLYGGVFGKRSGPEVDSIYATLLSGSANGCCPKNFGFFYGFGRAANWPAVRAKHKQMRPGRR